MVGKRRSGRKYTSMIDDLLTKNEMRREGPTIRKKGEMKYHGRLARMHTEEEINNISPFPDMQFLEKQWSLEHHAAKLISSQSNALATVPPSQYTTLFSQNFQQMSKPSAATKLTKSPSP